MRGHLIKKTITFISLFLFIPTLLWAGAPTSSYTYTTGNIIYPNQVQRNETNIYRYLQEGVDTLADNSVTTSKIYDGTIVNADISGTAAITYGKLSLTGSILNADIVASAGIPYSKLDLGTSITSTNITDDTIVNADINSSAAIVDTKLNTISTAGKVLGSALNTLSGVPSGAGQIPVANLGTGTGSSSNYLRGDGAWTAFPADVNTSNVIFCWIGSDSATTNIFGMVEGTSLTPVMSTYTINYHFLGVYSNTYRTILTGKFVKIAGISTVTIHAKVWTSDTSFSLVKVDIGGANNTVTRNVASPDWATPSTIDVSGLTNGTTYDITIQLKSDDSKSGYCSGVILTGS